MKITNFVSNISRTDVVAHYELEVKHEERKAFAIEGIVIFVIFALLPFMVVRAISDFLYVTNEFKWTFDILIMQSLIIIILIICLTTNTYRCGKLWRTLQKADNLHDIVTYINRFEEVSTSMRVAYILQYNQYSYAYLTNNKELIIIYNDNEEKQKYFRTYDYDILYDNASDNVTLMLDADGIHLINL